MSWYRFISNTVTLLFRLKWKLYNVDLTIIWSLNETGFLCQNCPLEPFKTTLWFHQYRRSKEIFKKPRSETFSQDMRTKVCVLWFFQFNNKRKCFFLIGSIFHIDESRQNNDEVWITRMRLCGNNHNLFNKIVWPYEENICR
jgi:hypothetical protein